MITLSHWDGKWEGKDWKSWRYLLILTPQEPKQFRRLGGARLICYKKAQAGWKHVFPCVQENVRMRYQFSSTHRIKMPCKPAVVIFLSDMLCRCTLFVLDVELESCSFSHLFLCLWKPRHLAKAPGTFTLIKKLIITTLMTLCQPQQQKGNILSMFSFPKTLMSP